MKKCTPARIAAQQLNLLNVELSKLVNQEMCELCELSDLYDIDYEYAELGGILYDPEFSDLAPDMSWTEDEVLLHEASEDLYLGFQKARSIVLTKWAANFLIITGIVPNGELNKSCKLDTKLRLYGVAGRKVMSVLKEHSSEVAECLDQIRKESACQAYKQRKKMPLRKTPLRHRVLDLCQMSNDRCKK